MGMGSPAKGAALTVAETEVFSGSAPTSWTSLDLSAVVGANAALVILKAYTAGAEIVAVRKKGDTDDFYSVSAVVDTSYGAALYRNNTVDKHAVMIVTTDSSGIIEWITVSGTTMTIDIIAFIA